VVVGVADVLLLGGMHLSRKSPAVIVTDWCLRLANLDHNLQVLLIEGGESNLNNPWVYRPGICTSLSGL
jgi:hypothetical protein